MNSGPRRCTKLLTPLILAVLVLSSALALPAATPKALAQGSAVSYVSYPGHGVALCYPYLVETHGLLNLLDGTYDSLWPAYTAVEAECSGNNMTVVTTGGVYFISGDKITWSSFVSVGDVVGVTTNYVGVLANSDVIAVSPSGLAQVIRSPPNTTPLSFTAIGPVPVAAFGRPGAPYVYVAAPYGFIKVSVGGNVTSALVSGQYLVVSWTRGNKSFVSEYLVSTAPLSAVLSGNWTAPLPLTGMYSLIDDYLMGSYQGLTVILGLAPGAPKASLVFIGAAEPTPIGYYADGYTYVLYNGSWTPVPGFAFSFVSRSAVLTDLGNLTLLYALQPAELRLGAPITGYLYIGNVTIYASLQPADYELPSGTLIRSPGGVTISVEPPLTVYPSRLSPARLASVAVVVNGQVSPVLSVNDVLGVSSGDGALLAIRPQQAVVFIPPSDLSAIPGSWTSGGLGGPLVALYSSSSSSVYLYSLDGSLVATYPVTWIVTPTHIFTYMEGLEPYVVAEWTTNSTALIARYEVIGPSGLLTSGTGKPFAYDYSTGLEALVTSPNSITLRLGSYKVEAEAYNDDFYINGLDLSLANGSGAFYLVNLTTGTEVTVISGPLTQVVPLPDNMFAVYNTSSDTVNIYSLNYIEAQLPEVVVNGPPESIVTVNGTPVGHPPAAVYAPYFTSLYVGVALPGDQGGAFGEIVKVTAPYQQVNITPPADAELVFNISSPVPVSSVRININGTAYTALPGSSINVTPGYTYSITAESFTPYNDCVPTTEIMTPSVGINYVNITCHLFRPVLELVSAVEAQATVVGPGGFTATVNLTPGVTSYIIVPAAELAVSVRPLVSGYAARTVYVNATSPTSYLVNVTPQRISTTTTTAPTYGLLSVVASIPTADIYVYYPNGTVAASGVGSLTARLSPGPYTVKAVSPGYSWNVTVQVSPGSSISLRAVLTTTVTPSRRVSYTTIAVVIAVVIAVAVLAWVFMGRRAHGGVSGTPQI